MHTTSVPSVATTTTAKASGTSTTYIPPKAATVPSHATTAPLVTQTPLPTKKASYRDPEAVNNELRQNLVNILCTTKGGGYFQPLSGSGIIIGGQGVILTNAHVAQFFLLRDYLVTDNVDCIVRTGSPATATYQATLLYLPPAWIAANANQIKGGEAVGSGEDDYAFLLITGRIDGSTQPPSFSNLLFTADTPDVGEPVVLDSYPAQFLGGNDIQTNLYASASVSTVQKLYTFSSTTKTVDAVSLGNPIVSQSGSSGGPVARLTDGALFGIISTATAGTTTSSRELRAITLAHIDRSLAAYGQGGLVSFLTSGDLVEKANDFNTNIAPKLSKQLEDVLGN